MKNVRFLNAVVVSLLLFAIFSYGNRNLKSGNPISEFDSSEGIFTNPLLPATPDLWALFVGRIYFCIGTLKSQFGTLANHFITNYPTRLNYSSK